MKIYKISLFVLLFLIVFNNSFAQQISKKNYYNILFLQELDKNIIGTLKILSAFNETATAMSDTIDGNDQLKKFLLDMTLECSRIRKFIRETDSLSEKDRESEIRLIISSIRSDINHKYSKIKPKKDKENLILLETFKKELKSNLIKIRSEILIEEQKISENKEITKKYLSIQSYHFICSLLLDFIEPAGYLSAENRELLTQIIKHISASLRNMDN